MTNRPSVGAIVDGRYRIDELIGQGGMGAVFRATEVELDRKVALKCLHAELLSDEESRLRFEREGKVLADLSHQNILRCYRFGIWRPDESDGLLAFPYIATEFLEGQSLREVIENESLTPEQSLEIVSQVCSAMEYAHNQNVIHRDLKLTNIMLLEPERRLVKVVDFGLAKLIGREVDESQHLTRTGLLVGSVHTMSPEQCRGRKAENRSDIYSLGCVMFEMLSGVPPFSADNPIGIVHQHINQPVPLLSAVVKTKYLPPGLDAVLQKAMAKLPEARYQSMEAFRLDIEQIRAGRGENLISMPLPQGSRSLRSILTGVVALAAFVMVTLVVGRYGGGGKMPLSYAPERTHGSLEDHRRLVLAREASAARAQNRFDMAKRLHQDLESPAMLLQQELHDLQSQYWDGEELEQGLKVLDRKLELAKFCTSPISFQTTDLVLAFDRCLALAREESDPVKKRALRNLAFSFSDKADKIAGGAPPLVQARLFSSHALAALDQNNVPQARGYFNKMLGAVNVQQPGLVREQSGLTCVKHTFCSLVQFIKFWPALSADLVVEEAYMIAVLAPKLAARGDSDIARTGLREAQQAVKQRFSATKVKPELLERYNFLLGVNIERRQPPPDKIQKDLAKPDHYEILDKIQGSIRGIPD